MTMRVPWWRGGLVLATWIVWPPLFLLVDVLFSALRSGGCVDGCNDDPGLFALLFLVGPQIVVTVKWWRWRRAEQ
jgi:hypothetical protein